MFHIGIQQYQTANSGIYYLSISRFELIQCKAIWRLEFWLSIIKVITIVALIIVGIVMIVLGMKTSYGQASVTNLLV